MTETTGLQKASILMLALGESEAAEVMKFLGPREVLKLGAAMATMKGIAHEQVVEVLDDFRSQTELNSTVGLDSDEYIRQVLTKALGDDKAALLIDRILQGGDTNGIEGLKWMDAPTVADLIRNEHPQIIATILVHLEQDHASDILNHFTERLRNDVVLRIATLEGIQPEALKELNDVMLRLLSGSANIKKSAMGGVRSVAAARRATELGITAYNILEGFEGDADGLAQRGRLGGWRFHGLPWRQ